MAGLSNGVDQNRPVKFISVWWLKKKDVIVFSGKNRSKGLESVRCVIAHGRWPSSTDENCKYYPPPP